MGKYHFRDGQEAMFYTPFAYTSFLLGCGPLMFPIGEPKCHSKIRCQGEQPDHDSVAT